MLKDAGFIKAGAFADRMYADDLKDNPEFAPLRGRDDFQKLLQEPGK